MQSARQPGNACDQCCRGAHSLRAELPGCPEAVRQQLVSLLLQVLLPALLVSEERQAFHTTSPHPLCVCKILLT